MEAQTSHLPHAPGVYLFRDAAGGVLYVGKAKDLAKRAAQHFDPRRSDPKAKEFLPLTRSVDYLLCASEREALLVEDKLIKRYRPFFNITLRDDKTYPWLKLTIGEDFPRLFWTRRRKRDGSLYFGPYPKVTLVRSLIKYLFRTRIIPLRPCSFDFSTTKPLAQKKIQGCLYYHTKQCPAPCAGRISPADYKALAHQAALFFEGRYDRLEKDFDAKMQRASKRQKFEVAGEFRDRLKALRHMKERVKVHTVAGAELEHRLEGSRGVTALQKALALPKPPVHIECADISHLFGKETVASFVCFTGGEPNKDHYRRFKIKTVSGIDDFASMREVVGRRLLGLFRAGSPLPDLMLIDGGKGQLGAALDAMKDVGISVPAAGLAKQEEEIFLPGKPDSLRLDRADPALRLLQHLRDEAHRFAISYHRLLHGKALLETDDDASPSEPTPPPSQP